MIEESNLPALGKLKINANTQTTQISLRVKEVTRALFETEAQRSGLSTNALIGELLDTYAKDVLQKQMGANEDKLQILERYLETTAKKAGRLDTETLLRETIDQYNPEALFEGTWGTGDEKFTEEIEGREVVFYGYQGEPRTLDELIQDLAMWAEGKPTRFFCGDNPYFFVADGVVFAVERDRSSYLDIERVPNKYSFDCYLRADYFVAFMAIISAYKAKLSELFPERTAYLGEQAYRMIVRFANTVRDREEFALLVAKTILRSIRAQLPQDNTIIQAKKHDSSNLSKSYGDLAMPTALVRTMEELGRSAHLTSIYGVCDRILKEGGRGRDSYKSERVFQAVVRGTLERCSKDCNPNTKYNYFSNPNKGEGHWVLNPGVHYDKELGKVVVCGDRSDERQ